MEKDYFDGFLPSEGEVLVRNHLMVTLGFANSQRTGAIINAMVSEFEGAIKTGDTYTMLVRHHKTFHTHGHTRLVMSLSQHTMMNTYKQHIRPQYKGKTAKDVTLFLTLAGEQMVHSTYAKVVQSLMGPNVTMTKNRKQVVTHTKNSGATDQEMSMLAEHMTHSTRTQQRYYDTADCIERSVEVFQKVLRIPIATKTTDDCTTDEISAVVGSCTIDEVPGDSTIVAGDIPTAGGGDTVEPSLLSTASSKHGRRAGYTDEQETAIRTGIIHMPHIRSTMKAYPDMSECLNGYMCS